MNLSEKKPYFNTMDKQDAVYASSFGEKVGQATGKFGRSQLHEENNQQKAWKMEFSPNKNDEIKIQEQKGWKMNFDTNEEKEQGKIR